MYQVLLYYKYIHIDDPEMFARRHLALCRGLGLLGRILVAHEGINGTVSGTVEQTEQYMQALHSDQRFSDMEFKIDRTEGHTFRKLFVRARREIVAWNFEQDVDPKVQTGKRLTPQEFLHAMQREDVIIVDARNDYEYELGHFRGALRPPVKTSREFPNWVRENLLQYKDKMILTYCTGGIRCEKFSAYLLQQGFNDVSQLHGGIVSYGKDEQVRGQMFDGRCYVFDERVVVPINRTGEDRIISNCLHCGVSSVRLVNCANLDCDHQHICCAECEIPHRRSCSLACQTAPNHEFSEEKSRGTYSYYR